MPSFIAKTKASNIKAYVYLNGTPLARIDNNSQIYYYHNDHLGTPQAMTDSTGTAVWKASYEPFGKATVTVNTITNNLRLDGYWDQETNLSYNGARVRDLNSNRFLSSDPIGLAGGLNTYVAVKNNPLRWVDPYGLDVLNPNNYPVSPQVMQSLQNFNNYIGQNHNVVITGGDRPATSALGAGSQSQHVLGAAADINVPDQSHLQTANQASRSGLFNGIGWYEEGYRGPNGEGPHVHVDLRTDRTPQNPAQWGYDKNGNYGPIPPYNPPGPQPCK